jgi:hypothetical protein
LSERFSRNLSTVLQVSNLFRYLPGPREECVMRNPFSMEHLDDQKKSRQILLRLLVVYFSLGVLLVGVTHLRDRIANPQSEAARQEATVR